MNAMKLHLHLNTYGTRHAVGVLHSNGNDVVFRYNAEFLTRKIPLSPFLLPLGGQNFVDAKRTFAGIFGVFYDSLPAGWGLMRLDEAIRDAAFPADAPPALKRLALLGKHGMGALEYTAEQESNYDFAEVMLAGAGEHDLDTVAERALETARQGPLSIGNAGAGQVLTITITDRHKSRPYILAKVTKDFAIAPAGEPSGEPWIIKFRALDDDPAMGLNEYRASLVARAAGLDMPETHLFVSKNSPGYFGIKRFDRASGQKVHIHSASGLIHAHHRQRLLDYKDLIKLTAMLTGSPQEVLKMVRRMVFNVKAGNTDDHSKHFSFFLTKQNVWRLTPAYDIAVAGGTGGVHFTRVNGKDRNITDTDLIQAAEIANVPANAVKELIGEVEAGLATTS